MKKLFIFISIIIIFLSCSKGFCDEFLSRTLKFGSLVCQDLDDLKQILDLSGDKKAMEKAITMKIITNKCDIYQSQQEVVITDSKIWQGLYQVRKKGDYVKYWTYEGALSKK